MKRKRLGGMACWSWVMLFGAAGCWIRTPYLLKTLNSGVNSGSPPPRAAAGVRIARMVRTGLADSYFDVAVVASWMEKAGADPSPVLVQLDCLRTHRNQPEPCYNAFDRSETPAKTAGRTWGLPPVPAAAPASKPAEPAAAVPSAPTAHAGPADASAPRLAAAIRTSGSQPGHASPPPPEADASNKVEADHASASEDPLSMGKDTALREIDVERFAANMRSLASSLLALEDILGRKLTDIELKDGLRVGIDEARRYIVARGWHRSASRPTTAIVMSGGAATGAFTAGFVSRILEVLDNCHHTQRASGLTLDTCPDSRVDLSVGTSTGSLVGVLVDLFHTPGQEKRARELLVSNYTCVNEKDLYCVHSAFDWKLASSLKGLVHFDGIEKKLREAIALGTQKNRSEFVAVSVDFDSGDIFTQSDQDPVDEADLNGRTQAVLASIVEPVLGDPVDGLPTAAGIQPGTFIDGGIRAGLPMLEAVHRGAERTLMIATGSVDPAPNAHAASALPILLRTIDLATDQPLVGEVQQAETAAVVRRMVEYKVCTTRLGSMPGRTADTIVRDKDFCQRKALFPSKDPSMHGAETMFVGPGLFEEVAKTWKSTWVYRPEGGGPGAVGYSFDPILMRTLFEQGVRTFQARCDETLSLFSVPAAIRNSADVCMLNPEVAVARAQKTFAPIEQCHPGDHELRDCE